MGFYKELKKRIKTRIDSAFDQWVEDTEQGEGNKNWDKFSSVTEAVREFTSWLEEYNRQDEEERPEDEVKPPKRKFIVHYETADGTPDTEEIGCPTASHARIMFRREHPTCHITNISDVTTMED